jgi:two-component system, NarL family, response regulator LiaR
VHLQEKVLMHRDDDFGLVTRQSLNMSPTRLMFVDDHLMITEALAARLSAAMDLWVAGRCTTADPNLIDIVGGLRPDVIVIEIAPFSHEITDVLGRLMAARPQARVMVLTSDGDVAHAVEAARAGVAAWVAKEQGAAEFEAALRGVIKGEAWFPPHMLGEILRELRADAGRARQPDSLSVLSKREREVLLAMMDGKRGGQIATDLTISADTVRTHIRNIFAKLDVHSRLEAVRAARTAGLRAPEQFA